MPEKSVLQPTDADAIRLAKTLLRTARHGALACLDPASGAPLVSRVGVSTDFDGTPVILISGLAAHSAALAADPRCSLLLGDPGKGDPLAHPRISIAARAAIIGRDDPAHARIAARYLSHQPKARLYAELGDFRFVRLDPLSASLNGGFGRAYALAAADLLSSADDVLANAEAHAVEHMNEDHADAVDHYARYYSKAPTGNWVLAGIDAEGIDIVLGDDMRRIFFDAPLAVPDDMHITLVKMARTARQALGD
jgi:putative heme iron utilization protein